jgi:hypothetical protein
MSPHFCPLGYKYGYIFHLKNLILKYQVRNFKYKMNNSLILLLAACLISIIFIQTESAALVQVKFQ